MRVSARSCVQVGVVAALLATTVSCGGGGGDNTSTGAGGVTGVVAPSPPPPPPPAPPSPPPPPSPPASPPPPAASPPPPATVGDYKLVWQDEFNGSVIATKCWDYVNYPANNPSESQVFVNSLENSFVKDGLLNIVALKKNVTVGGINYNYTSAQLKTQGRASWTYGRFEARIKMPKGVGLWPTFWIVPQDLAYGGWPNSGEIDIAEWIGATPTQVYQSIHGPNTNDTRIFDAGKDLGADFHTYALEWTPTAMTYFVDGVQTNQITKWNQPAGAAFPAPFDKPFYIFLDLAVGNGWGGPPNAQTVFPATYQVDYVRVYQKGASAASPLQCS